MQLTRLMVSQYKWNIKCPYPMEEWDDIVVHNTANKASAMSEISYMVGNNDKVSYHFAIDDYRIVQGVEENRNTWNAGDGIEGRGNRRALSIEICHSTNPDSSKFDKAERLAAKFIAMKLKEKGKGIECVKKHQDYNGKYCPHKTLDLGWERFLNLIRAELGQAQVNIPSEPKSDGITVEQWQKTMNYCYNCNLAVDGSFGSDCTAKANKYFLKYKIPTIKNLHVEFIQSALIKKGYNVEKDRSFGPEMERVIRQFQKDHGLTVDGLVGANTTRALLK